MMRLVDLRALLAPYVVVKARTHRTELERLGVDPATARKWGWKPEKIRALDISRARLLPDGELPRLRNVVDVGANVGRWSQALLALHEPTRLIAIDPQPGVQEALATALHGRVGVDIVRAAVGSENGSVSFNVTAHPDNASVLDPRHAEMRQHYGMGYEVLDTIDVPQRTLDDLTADLGEIDLVKIDVQGYEREVIAGAHDALSRTRHVLLEVLFRSHYVDDLTFVDLHQRMLERGFELANLAPVHAQHGVALWSDALYTRAA